MLYFETLILLHVQAISTKMSTTSASINIVDMHSARWNCLAVLKVLEAVVVVALELRGLLALHLLGTIEKTVAFVQDLLLTLTVEPSNLDHVVILQSDPAGTTGVRDNTRGLVRAKLSNSGSWHGDRRGSTRSGGGGGGGSFGCSAAGSSAAHACANGLGDIRQGVLELLHAAAVLVGGAAPRELQNIAELELVVPDVRDSDDTLAVRGRLDLDSLLGAVGAAAAGLEDDSHYAGLFIFVALNSGTIGINCKSSCLVSHGNKQ
jgi:hypothetical protein